MLRIDKYLQMRLEGISRNKIQAAAKASCIVVNGKAAKSNYKVKPCDTISILLPEPPHEFELVAEDIPLKVVYEDDDVLVIDKQPGLVVHPGVGNYTGTLLNGLLHYFQDKKGRDGEPISPYLVHRIDKDTSGLLLIAKNEAAQVVLAKQFFDHTIERKYNALVWGDFADTTGTIDGNLERSPKDRRVMMVCDPERGKHAVTHWSVVERFGYVTLVECVLETGRTHQIRAHMRSIGHPLFNDAAYGGNEILKGTTFTKYKQFVSNCFQLMPRQALHALVLGFEHPTTGQHMHFESPMPDDFSSLLAKWRGYAQNGIRE
ncbi:MAG: RluA family pseudouridine synthase [Bacteroidales bacterium]|nr:RluA family pseudouridine synthase [Bacteroidales bacterium]